MTYEREAATEADLAMIFTGSVEDLGSGPLAEFQITNEAAYIKNIGARGNLGATFLMSKTELETRIEERTAQDRDCSESQAGLDAINKFKPR